MQQQGQLRVTQGGSLPLSRSPLQSCFVSCSENLWPQLRLPHCCESHWSLWPPYHRASFCFSFLSSWVPNLKICCNCSSPPPNLPSLLADHLPKPRGQGYHHPQTPLQWQQLPFPELLWPVTACTKAKLLSWPPPESAIPISSQCSLGCQSSVSPTKLFVTVQRAPGLCEPSREDPSVHHPSVHPVSLRPW